MKFLLPAYACAPNTGSEYDIGWKWSLQSAKQHETWVLTKCENKDKIEKWKETQTHCIFSILIFPVVQRKSGGRLDITKVDGPLIE